MKGMTLENICRVSGGSYHGDPALLKKEVSAVTIDSRLVSRDCLFAALAGANTDGHRYIPQAFAAGALCALAERLPEEAEGPVIVVEAVTPALQRLAAFYRSQFSLPVVGITGSVGKTTAKEMVAAVLAEKYTVHKTIGNFNNELGVPLTLFGLNDSHTAAVIEMGISDFGEMRRLTAMVQPSCALFTVIGYAHLEQLGDREGVLRAKSEMLEGLAADGTVFVNGDDELLSAMPCAQRKLLFGLGEDCDVRAVDIRAGEPGQTLCTIVCGGRRIPVEIPAYGDHMVYAALEGAAVGLELGLSDGEIARGIARYEPVGHRGRVLHTPQLTIIDDCYNANPTSMASAIRSLEKLPGRRVCILGDMLELGQNAEALHRDMGALAAERGAALVLTCGELGAAIAAAAGEAGRHFESREALIAALPKLLHPGDTVLVKASHSMKFEEIVKVLEPLALL